MQDNGLGPFEKVASVRSYFVVSGDEQSALPGAELIS